MQHFYWRSPGLVPGRNLRSNRSPARTDYASRPRQGEAEHHQMVCLIFRTGLAGSVYTTRLLNWPSKKTPSTRIQVPGIHIQHTGGLSWARRPPPGTTSEYINMYILHHGIHPPVHALGSAKIATGTLHHQISAALHVHRPLAEKNYTSPRARQGGTGRCRRTEWVEKCLQRCDVEMTQMHVPRRCPLLEVSCCSIFFRSRIFGYQFPVICFPGTAL